MKYIFRIAILISLVFTFSSSIIGQVIISGTITSAQTGEPLYAVNVIEVDQDNRNVSGGVTDFSGNYRVNLKDPENNKVVITCIGYELFTLKVTGSGVYDVKLNEETQELDVVTVTAEELHSDGTFTIAKREIAQATQKISAEEFEGLQVTSVDEALQGRIAGLDIVAASGDPGSGTTMRIRGATSINSGQVPLIVINGIPFESQIDEDFDFANSNQEQYANLLAINPDDIEEITVLKDAASSAVWGIRGANGVIMIKTKRGAKGPTKFQYTYRLTRTNIPKGYKLLNGDDYTMLMKQAYFNPYQNEFASDIQEFNYSPSFPEYENYNNNTDWVDEVSQTGVIHDHVISASGGGDRARYRISSGFFDQKGTIIGQELNRISTRASLDYNISNRLRVVTEFAFTYTDNHKNVQNLLGIAYKKIPNESVYYQYAQGDRQGENTDVYHVIADNTQLNNSQANLANPVALGRLGINRNINYRIIPTFRVMYDIIRPEKHRLKYQAYINFDLNNTNVRSFTPREAVRTNINEANGSVTGDNENFSWQTDNNLTFTPKFNNEDHKLTLYASFQARMGRSVSQGEGAIGGANTSLTDPAATGFLNQDATRTGTGEWRSAAMLARGHYVYKGRYIVSGTLRRDGSTRFGEDNKFGNFPGVSLKWIISDEPFMQSSKHWLSMLAIRPSWGISGNQPGQEGLHFMRYNTTGKYLGVNAISPASLRLNNLKWETTTSYNLGADIGFFNDKLVFDLNAYYQLSDDLLFPNLDVPETTGFNNLPNINAGSMENVGWEFNMYGNRVIKVNDFSVDFNFNIANNINTLISLDPSVMVNYNKEYTYSNGDYRTRVQENNSFGSIYGFRYDGVYRYDKYVQGSQEDAPVARDLNGDVIYDGDEPLPMMFAYGINDVEEEYEFRGGDAKYEDINHDGSIDELDIVYLGSSTPKFNGGFNMTLKYKDFYCNMFFNFRYGNKVINRARMNLENMYTDNNQSIAVNYRWRKDGDVTTIPRALYNHGYNWLGSDRYVEDGSFVRFKYLKFAYKLPKNKIKKLGLERVDVYVAFNNLAVFTKYSGLDPEVGYGLGGMATDNSQTPRSRDMMFGLTVGF